MHLFHLSPHLSHLSHLSHHIFLIFFSPESHCPHLSYLLIYLFPIDLNPRPRLHSSYSSFFHISHHMTHMTCISSSIYSRRLFVIVDQMQKPSLETKADRNSDRSSQKSQNPQKIISLTLCHSLWVSESLNLWGKSRLCDVWWSVWCDHLCDFFFCERKCLDSFSHKPSLRSKILKLETLKQIGQKSEPQSENFAFVIQHSSSGPLIEQIWN